MRIYIAGPMRGLPDYNFPAFDAARDFLAGLGHDVINPADLDRVSGAVVESGGHVAANSLFSVEDVLRRDFAAICSCDAVAFLPGWERSSGSLAERRVAVDVGCQLWRVDPIARTLEREVVVALSGYARAGKDTVAKILKERQRFATGAFADALKLVLAKLDPIICDDIRLSDIAGGMEEAKALPEVRCLLQRLGTEAGRKVLGPDVWVRSLLDRPPVRLAVSDCRFVDEAEAVRARGGIIIRVNRPGFGPINGHVSETALDGYDFDAVLVNDGSIEDLAAKVEAIVPALGLCQSTARQLSGVA